MYARQFGISKSQGLAKTAFTQDWTHSIFCNPHVPAKYQTKAQALISSEIVLSASALMYFQYSQVSDNSYLLTGILGYRTDTEHNVLSALLRDEPVQCYQEPAGYRQLHAAVIRKCLLHSPF